MLPSLRNIKHPVILVGVLALLVLGVGLGWFRWVRQAERPPLRLKVAKRTFLEGKPLTVFRLEVANGRRVQMEGFEFIKENRHDACPVEIIDTKRNEFGVFPPADAAAWRVAVYVQIEDPNELERLKKMLRAWRILRSHGCSCYKAAKGSWEMFYPVEDKVVVSETVAW